MLVDHLSLHHFRNYISQEMDLPKGLVVLLGDNAQGKSNLLEAVFLLAAGRSHRARTDREMVGWSAGNEPIPYARVAGRMHGRSGQTSLEVIMQLTKIGASLNEGIFPWGDDEDDPSYLAGLNLQKRFRVNSVRRPVSQVIGLLKAVLIGPDEVDLVGGPPSIRRRYLDIANCQLDSSYLRALQRYQRALAQRNALLRRIRDRQSSLADLSLWDDHLTEPGAYLLASRYGMMSSLQRTVAEFHSFVAIDDKAVRLDYQSTTPVPAQASEVETREVFMRALEAQRPRDLAQGITTVGPHRDDLRLLVGRVDMGVYGSRGQQRTLALALKLAEARYMRDRSGEAPVLLLDDVLSELDSSRRERLLELCGESDQLFLTVTDLDRVSPRARDRALVLRVSEGRVVAADP